MNKYAALALVALAVVAATGSATTDRDVVIGHVYGPAISSQ